MTSVRLICDTPSETSLPEIIGFLQDITTLYDRLVYLLVDPSNSVLHSSQFRRTIHRLPPDFDIRLLSIRKASPLELKLGIPETVKEIREFLIEALELARDWKYHKQKRQIDLEKDRLALVGIKAEMAFQRETNKIKLARLRQDLDKHAELDVLDGEQAISPRFEVQSPKLLEESTTSTAATEPEPNIANRIDEPITNAESMRLSNNFTIDQANQKSTESAFVQLKRDIARIAASPNNIVSVDPLAD